MQGITATKMISITSKIATTTIDKFWARVDRRGPDECWPWLAGKGNTGYGVFRVPRWGSVGAHRLAYELTNGQFDRALLVLHRCDNPPCCNPAHLFLGTHHDNNLDMARKCRNGLNRSQVFQIFDWLGEGRSVAAIARDMQITENTVRFIRRGKTHAPIKAEYQAMRQTFAAVPA